MLRPKNFRTFNKPQESKKPAEQEKSEDSLEEAAREEGVPAFESQRGKRRRLEESEEGNRKHLRTVLTQSFSQVYREISQKQTEAIQHQANRMLEKSKAHT